MDEEVETWVEHLAPFALVGHTYEKPCAVCEQVRPLVEFSTLARYRTLRKDPARGDLESITCTGCYWRQLVTEYAQLRLDPDGRYQVVYVPYEQPRLEYVDRMRQWLPGWVKDEVVVKAYSALGDLRDQARPFWAFVQSVVEGR